MLDTTCDFKRVHGGADGHLGGVLGVRNAADGDVRAAEFEALLLSA